MDPTAAAGIAISVAMTVTLTLTDPKKWRPPTRVVVWLLVLAGMVYGVVVILLMEVSMTRAYSTGIVLMCAAVGALAGLVAVKHVAKQGVASVVEVQEPEAARIGTPRPTEPPAIPASLVRNGGFEQDMKYWTKYFLVNGAQSIARVDTTVHRNTGRAALRIEHQSEYGNNIYATFAQTVYDLEPRRFYRLSFFVKSASAERKALFVTTAFPWVPVYIDEGQYEWREKTYDFTPGSEDSIELRFVAQKQALIWLDDITITPLPIAGTEQPRR